MKLETFQEAIFILDKQYNLYSCDTGSFYSNREKYLHDMNCKYRKERNYVNNKLPALEKQLLSLGYSKDDIKTIKSGNVDDIAIIDSARDIIYEYLHWTNIIAHKRKKAKESKEKLLTLLATKVSQNESKNGKDHIRALREDSLKDNDVISIFDSDLSRTIGIQQDELTDALMVMQVYYFDVFKDVMLYGFTYKGEKYKYFTSSAGQIRKKKGVFIKENVWNKIEKTAMCGLTLQKINEKGGNNVNKHLAYLALSNSATDVWKEFDIDKSIVVDDFETDVYGTFDFVDETDYSITRKTDYVPVPHTDGAGMILPSLSKKNFMFRAPWIKGLLGVFDFKRFIEVNNCTPIIKDIYGIEHNIINEDIQIIFTKSQFKLWKYYDSWEQYKQYFKQYSCTAGICNIEEDRIKNAKINYQMLQTLTNITEDEIDLLTHKSHERISNVATSKETMMDILGVTPYNTNMTPFQKSVKLYPALLGDTYAKDVVREVKNSLLKKYRSGKLEVYGKYTFILPDFYAACEYWFGHVENPKGLLNDKEVYCKLFRKHDKLDCLRSPHLYREHAIRFNVANSVYGERTENLQEWFTTNGLYTSTHDLISKLLQFDVDGDKSLVVADKDFVRIAERNMNGIVPLYYNMRKAESAKLNNRTIYEGLNKAFTGGNIGLYSNNISKIWNHEVFISGSEEEQKEALDCIKRLCCQNNFVIDFAKTLYKPEFPPDIKQQISKYTNTLLPAFFEFAKDKDKSQVNSRNQSFVNKIYDRIPNKPINTRNMGFDKIDYKFMMDNHLLTCTKEISDLYDKLNRQYRYMINMKDEYTDNLRYVACKIRDEFNVTGYTNETIADMLVEYLYGRDKRYKQLLWFCYGQYIYNNLVKNIGEKKTKFIQCVDCDEWIEVDILNTKTCRCEKCQYEETKRIKREYKRQKSQR